MDLPAGHTRWLGATPDSKGRGTNFAFYAGKHATRVELCLFDKAKGENETKHFELKAKEDVRGDNGEVIGFIWHGFAAGVQEGQMYGFRVDGPYDPSRRLYHNANKLLVDPCAKAVTHEIHTWEDKHFPSNFENNGTIMPKARVVDWQKLHREAAADIPMGSCYPYALTNTMEMHVKGGTYLNEELPKHERGTFSALANPKFIKWVKDMVYTGVELMPVESFGTDAPLAKRGLKNYWGYMTMAPMAPHTEFGATDRPEVELAHAIRAMKKARNPEDAKDKGLEVIMDVVPNHTLESGRDGPVVNLRGMDDTLYLHNDYTGTGNTRDFGHPINRRMFLEELKYWQGLGVAGFRIDLATIIGRSGGADFDPDHKMLKALREDFGLEGGLQNVKFYGEPWDLGPNGYQIGRLAHHPKSEEGLDGNLIAEWDGKARDMLQQAALNPDAAVPRSEMTRRIAGSSDLYEDPQHHVVKVTSHDSMSLDNLVTFKQKHNEDNLENNNDGNGGIANWGVEGPTDDPVVNGNRKRTQFFAVASLAMMQGGRMFCLGHERGHSQDGNSNAYCQDNAKTHVKWGKDVSPEGYELMEFTRFTNTFRKKHPSLSRATHFTGEPDQASGLRYGDNFMKDVTWLTPDCRELRGHEMDEPGAFGMMLSGDPGNSKPHIKNITRVVQHAKHDEPVLALFNPTNHDMEFKLPDVAGVKWKSALNSLDPKNVGHAYAPGATVKVGYRSLIAFEGQRELAMRPVGSRVLENAAAAAER